MDELDPATESVLSYLERLEQFFIANKIGETTDDMSGPEKAAADKCKVATLISVIGKNVYSTLRDLCKPALPKESNFKELCDILTEHFSPKKLEVAETFRFHRCIQGDREKVSEFVARLRRMASTCNFGAHLDRAMRDQFISGVRHVPTQRKLLERDRNFDDCVKVAIADEAAGRETAQFQEQQSRPTGTGNSKLQLNKFSNFSKGRPRNTATGRKQWSGPSNSNFEKKVQSNGRSGKTFPAKQNNSSTPYRCRSCGKTDHPRDECFHKNALCYKCQKRGHIQSVCGKFGGMGLHNIDLEENSSETEEPFFFVSTKSVNEICVPVKICNKLVNMQLDTGCALSLAPKSFYDEHCTVFQLKPTAVVMTTYTGEKLYPLGEVMVDVEYGGQQLSLPLLILPDGDTLLFGRNWLQEIRLDWSSLPGLHYLPAEQSTTPPTGLHDVLDNYKQLFDDELGCYNGPPVELKVNAEPKFYKARPLPYAMLPKVEETLKKMACDGVIESVASAPCAAPIVPVNKKDTSNVRVCGDFSVTYNACADVVKYPIPKMDDLHAALRGCKVFSILDMSQAYHQIPVSCESRKYLTINTHIGLFQFTRLPNGIHSGPAVFQRIMDTVLAGIPRVITYIDDILLAGVDEQDCLRTLSVVCDKLLQAGFRLNKSKCQFLKSSVTYLGHVISAKGLQPTEDKLAAVRDAPQPKNVTALKSFLGLIMFYAKFLPNHSTVLAPLNRLLRKNIQWRWTNVENAAFVAAKRLLLNSKTLVHYDENLPLYLACDASSYGAGCVLSHRINGLDRPIAFASCTLTPTQQNYSQLDKEAFSIIFGLKRFSQFLYGRSFTIITDHRPLLQLLGPHKPVPYQAAARLQRWALILASYNYSIEYRNTTAHANADSMSRLPLPTTWSPKCENMDCFFFEEDICSNIDHDMIKKQTARDPVLSKVYMYCMNGWPNVVDPELVPYKHKMQELTTEQGCVLWGMRVVVPRKLQDQILMELHETHPGMTKMKMLARSYVWWPNIDSHIEHVVSSCHVCQAVRAEPKAAQVHPWTFPSKPWSRIHIDFAGPVAGRTYLVVVDAYSKFPEVLKMTTTTSASTINALSELYGRYGLPEILVSDNAAQFMSQEFQDFCARNGVQHRTSSVYKPATNGQAERVVQILKNAIKKAQVSNKNIDIAIQQSLLVYRTTPHSTTGESPSVLFMGRNLRTRLDLLRPCVQRRVEKGQHGILTRTAYRGCRTFTVGDSVLARNFGKGEKWRKGVIAEILGTRHYIVHVGDGVTWKRHVDQLLKATDPTECEDPDTVETVPNLDENQQEIIPVSVDPPTVPLPDVELPEEIPSAPIPDEPPTPTSPEVNLPEEIQTPNIPELPTTPDVSTASDSEPVLSDSTSRDTPVVVRSRRSNTVPTRIPTPRATERRYPQRQNRKRPAYLDNYTT
jgi:transposase InsO family protein